MSTAADNSSLRKSQGTRLMAARRHFKLETQALGAKFLAKATGQTIKADTYAQHENGIRSMSRAVAIYAEGYSVSEEWLLYDRNPPPWAADEPSLCEVIGSVGADPEGRVLYASADSPRAYAPPPPGGSALMPVLDVVGPSMPGYAANGSLIYLEEQRTPPTADMVGEVIVAEIDTGEILLKRLQRGSKSNLWTLESFMGQPRTDVRIRWAAFVFCVLPPRAAKRALVHSNLRAA